ncbi:MAG: hypothetical protein H6667_16575 [Ardenticatenaceae bacterium]|nr:hypothetical protein [Ardenticatenaceae bacterium]
MMNQEKEIQETLRQLSVLEPQAGDAPRPAAQALARVKLAVAAQKEERFMNRVGRWMTNPNRRLATAVALFLVVFMTAFSFPAVRAAASDFLGLFRVQKFAAISVSPEQIALLQQVAEEGLMPGQVEIIQEPGELHPVDSVAAAQAETGMAVVRTLAGQGDPAEIWVAEGGNGRLLVDLAGARKIVEAAGADPSLLPDSLDGAQVDVTVFAGVQQQWVNGIMLMQTASPEVDYPDDVNPTVLGEALLQMLGLNAAEAQRLAQNIDWTSTLLLPIPQDFASFNEVTVEGVSGLALNSVNGEGSALFWQKDGVVYLLLGPGLMADDLVSLAGTLE